MKIYETKEESNHRLSVVDATTAQDANILITLHPEEEMQKMIGFGGAFTESTAYNLSRLSPANQEIIMKAYFGAEGNDYRLGRAHIHSCDFSLENYTYMNDPKDTELKSFSIHRDHTYILPLIKKAQRMAGSLELFASPWSPPSFMKSNNLMNRGGKLRPEFAQMWADYMVKFLQEYKKEGINFFAVTVQNEPEAHQTWESCLYTGEEEAAFVRDHLGPTLKKSGLNTSIILYDHNRDHVFDRAKVAYDNPQTAQYLWGVGVHWYVVEQFENLTKVHNAYPDKHIIFTEGCVEGGCGLEGKWRFGETYGYHIINDLNNWVEGWCDWNLVLDEMGGPNHVENYCSAPIMADTVNDKVVFQNSYYYIGHFSRFIKPGYVRIGHEVSATGLYVTTWKGDGKIVIVVLNRNEAALRYRLSLADTNIEIGAHAIQTVIIDA
ncbi:glycoside hydrolase family 30 protein [Entomospira culicis]|uniref:Glycoside hydrolase family 30 protein n=1 Tax=Entomospira culicis TaxID=2719989 RepID=A0A968GGN8_9SPIO|nr:glycoside hydrolase family 30 protein [Entomospira culicis]NIZ19977.1 glycoside hydrolase family 30 protein [Entomospira culicis]NIZ70158.1 glycoside hydrolase family 30 protein [Entomospira culicis]WDI37991.1 glycoside hydrolase family 30 protein [Entomospira culicis]WDI39614.1 glycoside hydrolase family 30 protein [Entomospira culicis]